jgi:excinuclease UvrABC ATPase subunit
VIQGVPESVAECERSHTGRYLRALLAAPAHALAG